MIHLGISKDHNTIVFIRTNNWEILQFTVVISLLNQKIKTLAQVISKYYKISKNLKNLLGSRTYLANYPNHN